MTCHDTEKYDNRKSTTIEKYPHKQRVLAGPFHKFINSARAVSPPSRGQFMGVSHSYDNKEQYFIR